MGRGYTIFIMAIIMLLFNSFASASNNINISGSITRDGRDIFLIEDKSKQRVHLQANTTQTSLDLSKLDNGDRLSFVGTRVNKKTILVKNINSVGLRKVLGIWQSSDWKLFDFKNFESLSTTPAHEDLTFTNWRNFHYSLAPGQGPHWTIFMVNKESMNFGHLKISHQRMELVIINHESGEIDDIITFHKISPAVFSKN